MTAQVLAFTGSKKARRETKVDLAARILPKVLGILQGTPIDMEGRPRIVRFTDGIRFRADHWNPEPSVRFAEVSVLAQGQFVLEAYVYHWPQRIGDNLLFNRRVWLRKFDFAARVDWIPLIAALDAADCSPEAFYSWFAPLTQTQHH